MTAPTFSPADLAYIKIGLILHKQSLQRSLNKEIAGSEIFKYRVAQIADIDLILSKTYTLNGDK